MSNDVEGKRSSSLMQNDGADWKFNLTAVKLGCGMEGLAGGGSSNGLCGGEESLQEEEVVEYLFSASTGLATELSNSFCKDVETKGCASSEGPVASGEVKRTPRRAQLYWLDYFRDLLRPKIEEKMRGQNTTTYFCGVSIRALSGGGSGDNSGMEHDMAPVVGFHVASRNRLSHCLRDPRYMRPSPLVWCRQKDDLSCFQREHGEQPLPFIRQPWVSTDFIFTRAEAFFDFEQNSSDAHEQVTGYSSVPLDPYLSFLTPDEEGALLAARLWTSGWDIYAPTELIAFVAGKHDDARFSGQSIFVEKDKSTYDSGGVTVDTRLRHMRERSLARLRFVLFGSGSTRSMHAGSTANTSAEYIDQLKDIRRYGLGTRRSREAFLRHANVQSDGKPLEGSKLPGEWKHYTELCEA
ncbi:putative Glycosyltransferase (GlcNAc) [Trypanosoma vivax]|nr:putative Glycosyltransferase (GlcNAc) [Trypanosoma vivax]